jgi:hypothetical protein
MSNKYTSLGRFVKNEKIHNLSRHLNAIECQWYHRGVITARAELGARALVAQVCTVHFLYILHSSLLSLSHNAP